MRKHNVKLIVNPNADMGRAWEAAADLRPIVEEFGGADWAGTAYPTHATELARQAGEEGYELVIAGGGDGTAHEILNGLMQVPAGSRPKLGLLPLGSGNDFSHTLGMDKRPAYALRQILTGKSAKIDIGRFEIEQGPSEYFGNAFGIGFDATVTIRSHRLTYVRGFMMYLVAVLQTIILNHDAPRMQATTDQESWDEPMELLVICNGPREGGGFFIAPDAKPSDGVFHYAGIYKISRLMMLRLLPEVMKGTHGRFKQVRMGQLRSMQLQADRRLTIHADGEILAGFDMDVRHVSVELLPGALEIMA